MSCECTGVSYTRAQPHKARVERAQLGPAYEAYHNGEIDVPTKWRPTRTLADWVPDCCLKMDPNWTQDELWKDHTIMLSCFYAISTILLALFLYFRNEQPLKFRDYRSIIMFYLAINVEMTIAVIMGNTGGTGPSILHLIVPFSLPSTVIAYYIVKSVQVYFIYAWNQAKLNKRAFEKIRLFHTFRFVLDYRAYFVTLATLLMLTCAIPTIYALLARPVFSEADYPNAYNTVRCEWWQIPEEYQQKKSNSTLCSCILYATSLPGGTREECQAAVMNVCFTHTQVDPADAGFCEACLSSFVTENIGSECTAWLSDFYMAGNCGHPAEVPVTTTCKTGIFADKELGVICAVISYFLWAANIVVTLPLIGKQDDFGLILENILTNVVATVALFFAFAGIVGDHDTMFEWWYNGLQQEYRPVPFFTWVGCFWSMLMTLGFPLCLYAHRKNIQYSAARQAQRQVAAVQAKRESELYNSVAVTDGGVFGGELLDEGEQAIEICVRHPRLRAIYSQFAVEAFHVENIRFLEDCAALLEQAAGQLTTATLSAIADSAQMIYDQYIVANSPMEINIPARRRAQIKTNLDGFLERVQSGARTPESSQAPESSKYSSSKVESEIELIRTDRPSTSSVASQTRAELEALVSGFAAAYTEIRRLLARDCWPRFKVSRFYQAYNKLIEEEAELSMAVSGMSIADPSDAQHSKQRLTEQSGTGTRRTATELRSTTDTTGRPNDLSFATGSEFSAFESEKGLL